MYPIFHEPTFTQDVEDVYNGSTDPYQNYCLRMVIAISLQKMDTQYAGLADSYYLAALKYFEAAIKPMNLKTLQCFGLVGLGGGLPTLWRLTCGDGCSGAYLPWTMAFRIVWGGQRTLLQGDNISTSASPSSLTMSTSPKKESSLPHRRL